MVAINKYLLIAVVASALLAVSFAEAKKQPSTEEAPIEGAKHIETAKNTAHGVIDGISNIGNRVIGGIKGIRDTVVSHLPSFGTGNKDEAAPVTTAAPTAETTAVPVAETTAAPVAETTAAAASEAPAAEEQTTPAPEQ